MYNLRAASTEVQTAMKEDSEVLNITGSISEMKITDSEQFRNSKDEVSSSNSSETEYSGTYSEDETTDIQQLKNSDDDEELWGLDQDEDRTHPAYIPRAGLFFMHDNRETGKKFKSYSSSRADGKWQHDLYNETEQMPLSNQEFAEKYGVDREGNPVDSVCLYTLCENFPWFLCLLLTVLSASRQNCFKALFSASPQDTRESKQTRIWSPTNVRNAPHNFRTQRTPGHWNNDQDKRTNLNKRRNDNRFSLVDDALNEEYSGFWKNRNLNRDKEAEKNFETNNIDHSSAKLETRRGKRYSTQRPVKSVEE
uniref:Protein CASC3 n=1 Tax=Elaeophora elaphi TaxID=1147741 RepID=A0A0R3RQ78_9BILA